MPCTPARLAANRRNAQLSTGPKTEEGKARARANAVKHGLTGAGIALPGEDAEAVAALFDAVRDELAPGSVVGAFLAQQVALAMVRCGRAARGEAALVAGQARRAAAERVEAREAHADALYAALRTDPPAIRRRLMTTHEGIERLLNGLLDLREGLVGPVIAWDWYRSEVLATLLGRAKRDFDGTRADGLARAVLGDCGRIAAAEVEHLDTPAARADWACDRLIELIDAEFDELAAHRDGLDAEADADPACVPARALADPDRAAVLARRYEAQARRDFSAALRDLGRAEALAGIDPGPPSSPDRAGDDRDTPDPSTPPSPGATGPVPRPRASDVDPGSTAPGSAREPAPPAEGPATGPSATGSLGSFGEGAARPESAEGSEVAAEAGADPTPGNDADRFDQARAARGRGTGPVAPATGADRAGGGSLGSFGEDAGGAPVTAGGRP